MCFVVALLGNGESPADGVADYCDLLARALADEGVHIEIDRVGWFESGWTKSLFGLLRRTAPGRGDWALVQYTAMAWSRHGFPVGVLAVVAALRLRGVRCAIVMHEASSQHQHNNHLVERTRTFVQDRVIGTLYRLSTLSIFTIPLTQVRWLPSNHPKSVFIPLGANIPECEPAFGGAVADDSEMRTVSVFCLSGRPNVKRELDDISSAARVAVENGVKLRVLFVGRGTEDAAVDIAAAFQESGVEIVNLGIRKPIEVASALSKSDAFLFVRGAVSLQRSSALAGIACGLPVIGYGGEDAGTPLIEAGTLLVPLYDQRALGEALSRVLLDDNLRKKMRAQSSAAQSKYFSWVLIAKTFMRELGLKLSNG